MLLSLLQHDIFPKRAQVFSNSQLDKTAPVAALEKKVIHTEKTMIYNLTTMGNNLSNKKLRPWFFREMNLVLKHRLHSTRKYSIYMQGFLKVSQFIGKPQDLPWDSLESTLNLRPTEEE